MKSALIVIDVQQSFVHRPYFSEARLPRFLLAQNALIGGCARAGVPVVRVLHEDGPDQPDNPFAVCSGQVRPLDGLAGFEPAASFTKHRHSALVGTGLDVWLIAQGVQRLMISGIRTEQCCETTARHASDLGWQVDFVTEATLTFDIARSGLPPLAADQVVERTVAALEGRFARVCGVDTALAALLPA